MPHSLRRTVLIAACLALGFAPVASAQQDSVARLQATDGDNRRHLVRLTTGEEVSGRLLQSGAEAVRLLVNGQEQVIPIDQIARLERSGDSLRNGAVIGAVIAGAWCALVCGQGLDSSGQIPIAVAANAGLGALVGAGIDAAHRGRTLLYPRTSPSARVRASGRALSLRFTF